MEENGSDNQGLAERSEKSPHPALWVLYLFFCPRTFFRHFAVEPNPALTAVCAWSFGMAHVIDRIGNQEMRGREVPFEEEWGLRWAFIAGGGALGGFLFWALGGWWYRVRLAWSGDPNANRHLARRVYLFASQILAVPTILIAVVETMVYDTPLAAENAEGSPFYLLVLILPFWSCLASTIGVRSVFKVRRLAAGIWFLVLPSVTYLVLYIPLLAVMASGSDLLADPNLRSPKKHESATLSFSYPGNWVINTTDEDFDPGSHVTVEPILADAIVKILVYRSDRTVEEELDATEAGYGELIRDFRLEHSSITLGSFKGSCRSGTGVIEGSTFEIRFFVAPLEGGVLLEFQELALQKQAAKLRAGFHMIYSSLIVKT